ncbi:hypothetical protein SAMN02745126_04483 [Enhydrobacter aerosaccus]|uniref:Uncharacterized protein n=1 Tax=Enhydrobacter aerosaccus TaxID=225324 RepID=A0A1T4S9W9_9HYPH|nr:hypothetical protein [Enhydrobacter aerosaccus]SKA25044.1 hypothetical protein SAMN02745126_04483 [Enhydrobacter aerosaccus]
MSRAFGLGVVAYVVPTFVIAYPWHLTVFAPSYHALAMYRDDVIVPLGLLSMLVQGVLFSWVYPRVFAKRQSVLRNGLLYGLAIGLLSWSFTTLAVAAKNVMTSVPLYLTLETGFTLVQFIVVGPLIALAHRR